MRVFVREASRGDKSCKVEEGVAMGLVGDIRDWMFTFLFGVAVCCTLKNELLILKGKEGSGDEPASTDVLTSEAKI